MDLDRRVNNCYECANNGTAYCTICTPEDNFFMDEETKAWNEMLCDMMCGGPEEEDKDGHRVIWLGDSDDFIS